jgi:hypothetical protein
MKRIRIMGLCLVAAFAMSALASSAASAEPVFLTKTVVAEGVKIPIKGTLGAAFLEGKSGSKITCTGGTSTGEITGPKKGKNNVTTFAGCLTGEFKCESAGQAEGVIVTNPLEANLNGITSILPGERLFSEAEGRKGKLAEFSCAGGAIPVIVKGSLVGSLSGASGTNAETGKLLSVGTLAFAEAGGIQKYTSFSEGPEKGEKEQLESSVGGKPFELSGQSVSVKIATVPATWQIGVTK